LAAQTVRTKDIANIRKVNLEMSPTIDLRRYGGNSPYTFCVGSHTREGAWVWDLRPIQFVHDDYLKKGVGQVTVDEKNVDIIALLFDSATAVERILFEAAEAE
jgi:hypothetical protein